MIFFLYFDSHFNLHVRAFTIIFVNLSVIQLLETKVWCILFQEFTKIVEYYHLCTIGHSTVVLESNFSNFDNLHIEK